MLVEGESDANAVRALAVRVGCDLDSGRIAIVSAGGVTNFARVLLAHLRAHPHARVCGMYDIGEEWHVRRALARAELLKSDSGSLEASGFFACVADLEDELIRALGVAAVERVVEEQSELASFRRFQAMPEHRHSQTHQQLHRFLGTRATRKIRSATRLAEALDLANLPRPLQQLAARLRAVDDA
ncbi:MAG TPA: TOPRIM nucleotidyl transferase/hydrolase domain-containing protein [Polyangiaceae bacterium]|nr:TOPRIM nucleotidyl transferase/hydrolase domain-containing protein [Polyangiaceae bacterium]